MADTRKLGELAKLVRYYILRMTTTAGSGHPTSSLSATDIMVTLFFNKLRFDLKEPENPSNDRVIFSKGHASPLLYALWAAAGVLSEKDLETYRQFGSPLEGHPTLRFKYVEVATGSLGQGLSIGLGMALAMRFSVLGSQSSTLGGEPIRLSSRPKPSGSDSNELSDSQTRFESSLQTRFGDQPTKNKPGLKEPYKPGLENRTDRQRTDNWLPKVYVLMGDSETSEGSVWEAIQLASYYKVGNLVGIVDVNRLGQSGETMIGWDTETYKKRVESFGWQAQVVDGHDIGELAKVFDSLPKDATCPQIVIAKTIKGKGVSFLEDKEGWHGKALSGEDFVKAVLELGEVDKSVRGEIKKPVARGPALISSKFKVQSSKLEVGTPSAAATPRKAHDTSGIYTTRGILPYKFGDLVPTRRAYGEALVRIGEVNPQIVALDAEVKNSTFSELFKEKFPERFFEMFIAEQNMVGVALGLWRRGKVPFVSTFASFLTRAFDQIRMSAYSDANIKFVGSHSGVSIGEDGPSQMGLEDLAMFRAVFGSVVFSPSDAVSCAKLVEVAAETSGLFYIRTARGATPVIYDSKEVFKIGGSKLVRFSKNDKLTIVSCGVALAEVLKATEELKREKINVRVIDAYSIKPIDEKALCEAANETNKTIITVEDHYFEGGLGDAVLAVFANFAKVSIYKLAVSKMPMSGKSEELLNYEGISAAAVVDKVREVEKFSQGKVK
ncbi:hypothetical protein A2697_02270 [Candidatus Curtissbacteria bacterium RIFCSPHIGHO2_01_FULL_41_44]|uniref:Transketolase-like pyrimidine-binding domain-containing protein n=1 Tax=Candidatus Curtissbacteria bacterium RIFCSPLOWO2_01_FULL_42_50 TaxID=1797730 RepID=A0A1F5H7V5_9BACT|nr:MAG: hypothetical protein A3C33_01435 [Candidatus Curtissbacteria bacterium RIFCSPHIGHO2_02_FULL_42_58]OGD94696.1 MAG: hypothetical protein A2697_02270 [Candidatus Curtissbacteria bacterium RIFCSPHIGHO2_01_FULL_41_44]OGE00211.1 MAG: hypothetical protein A3B54_02515 [Candidatus Curtissbacteria bacterium RIFCSPLOWO2_01_FULL_42_50]OGE02632.1 MAG: hypothetical protein A3G16_01355 [Candidatus Curtissbacteria bacterium RIFCSPLOWO2_12_FULL_41_16]OGE10000.1 MAG: hypothetical protein A3H87_01850 [Can